MTASLLLLLAAAACAAAEAPAGLSIERDDAEILLGAAGDVRLARGAGGTLAVNREVEINGTALLAAVQELRGMAEDQAAQIAALQLANATQTAEIDALKAQTAEIDALKAQVAALGALASEAAIRDAIDTAAQPGTDAKAVTDALGRFRNESAVDAALVTAAADGAAARAVTDALEPVVLQGGVQANLTAAAESVVGEERLADGAVTTEKLAAAAVTTDKLGVPLIGGELTRPWSIERQGVEAVGSHCGSGRSSLNNGNLGNFVLNGKDLVMHGRLQWAGCAADTNQHGFLALPDEVEALLGGAELPADSCSGSAHARFANYDRVTYRSLPPLGVSQDYGAMDSAFRNSVRLTLNWPIAIDAFATYVVHCRLP